MSFTESERAAWGGLLSAYAYLYRIVEEDLLSHSRISHVEFEILLRLAWAEDQRMRIQDLAAQSLLTRSGVSRAIARLEKEGLLRREAAPEDRRGAYAVLTAEGMKRFQNSIEPHVAFVKEHFLDLFTEKELRQMARFWKRISEHAQPEVAEQSSDEA